MCFWLSHTEQNQNHDRLNVKFDRKRESKDDSEIFGLRNYKDEVTTEMEKIMGEADLGI